MPQCLATAFLMRRSVGFGPLDRVGDRGGFETAAGDGVRAEGDHEDRAGGRARVEEVGEHPLGVPGGEVIDAVDHDQAVAHEPLVQSVDRAGAEGRDDFPRQGAAVPEHRGRRFPLRRGHLPTEPLPQDLRLPRSRRAGEHERTVVRLELRIGRDAGRHEPERLRRQPLDDRLTG